MNIKWVVLLLIPLILSADDALLKKLNNLPYFKERALLVEQAEERKDYYLLHMIQYHVLDREQRAIKTFTYAISKDFTTLFPHPIVISGEHVSQHSMRHNPDTSVSPSR